MEKDEILTTVTKLSKIQNCYYTAISFSLSYTLWTRPAVHFNKKSSFDIFTRHANTPTFYIKICKSKG